MYQTMRELMESARDAALDYAACERQLIVLRLRAESLGGGTLAGGTAGTTRDSLERKVVALADRQRDIEGRMARDEQVMDAACDVLYGARREDGVVDGLASLVPSFWCDAIWWHYIQVETWESVSRILGYSPAHIKKCAANALEVADSYGLAATIAGRGIAEDDTT